MSALEHPTPPPADLYVVGIDTSLTASGIAWQGARVGAVTRGRRGITALPLRERIPTVGALAVSLVEAAVGRWPGGPPAHSAHPLPPLPHLVLIEAPDTSGSYGGLVERTYLTCRVTESLMSMGVLVGWVPSPVLKGYCCGKGGGKIDGVPLKKVVKQRAQELWPESEIEDDNQADATVLAAMAWDRLTGQRRVDELGAAWLRRDSIEWPDLSLARGIG